MSSASQIATVLYAGIGLGALWITLVSWREYMTDKFRQSVFDLRAELFDYARGGKIDFHSKAYVDFRMLLNSMIRFAHEISFVRLAATIVLEKFRPCFRTLPNVVDELKRDPELSDEVKTQLEVFHWWCPETSHEGGDEETQCVARSTSQPLHRDN
jgi:hypothetical protein